MECCDNKNINNEKVCTSCGIIHGYKYVPENIFRDYNVHISNMLEYKKSIYRRKNIYIKNALILKKLIVTFYYFLIKV